MVVAEQRHGGVSLNPEILKCSDGVRTMLPLPDIQRGGNDVAGNTADIENAHTIPSPWRFTVSSRGGWSGRNLFPTGAVYCRTQRKFARSLINARKFERAGVGGGWTAAGVLCP